MHTCGQRVPKMSGSRRRIARTGGRLGSACAPASSLGQVMVRASPLWPPGVRDRARRPGPTTVPHPTGGRWICPRPKRSEVHVLITGVQLLSPATFHGDGYATQWSSRAATGNDKTYYTCSNRRIRSRAHAPPIMFSALLSLTA